MSALAEQPGGKHFPSTDPSSSKAGPSTLARTGNPQLSSEPYFSYPTPTPEELEEELPPSFEEDNVGFGVILDKVTHGGYDILRALLEQTLPDASLKEKPGQITKFAKSQRQIILKVLAILRWKTRVDVVEYAQAAPTSALPQGAASMPTPHSNGESTTTSPASGYVGKGKGRAFEDDERRMFNTPVRGKLTDSKRIAQFMQHQNNQHEMAINHLEHVTKGIETLRERNPDLMTAISLLTLGTYDRLPTDLTQSFKPLIPLTNRAILRTLRRLNRHLAYRLKCLEHLPPEMVIESIEDGKVYLNAGGEYRWKAQMTVVGFGEGAEGRWWLTGVEWGWKAKSKGTDDPGGISSLSDDERQHILDIVNNEVLVPKDSGRDPLADAPLIRLYNFLQHLSLSYQLETLYIQAIELSQGIWRNQLLVELDRTKRALKIRYWIRPRPPPQAQQPVNKRTQQHQQANLGAVRTPIAGATLHVSILEAKRELGTEADLVRSVTRSHFSNTARAVNLNLDIRWEVGEGGVGGGLKAGDIMASTDLTLDSSALSFEDLLVAATTDHAAHLIRQIATPLLASPRLILFPLNPPTVVENESGPAVFQIPLPSRQTQKALLVSISSLTGLIEIRDDGGTEARIARAKMASNGVNEHKARLLEDLCRLITAIITDNLEGQMRQLGWTPTRRIPLKAQDLAANDLNPSNSILIPLPSSPSHHFVTRVTAEGVTFELLKLNRTTGDKGVGMKLVVGDRSPMDLTRLRSKRLEKERVDAGILTQPDVTPDVMALATSSYQVDNRDLKDLFVFCNALVSQNIVEQQLKDRSIPYNLQYPPVSGTASATSSSAVAGMVPTICVQAKDLLKDGRASDVAFQSVYIQLQDWWKGGQCRVVTLVALRHKPAIPPDSADKTKSEGVDAVADGLDGISFDQNSSIVRFQATDISRCVPAFLEQWERLSKVIIVAGEVNRLNKSDDFKDLRMLSFDLRTATFTYATGHTAAITYTPQDDSYQVSFKADEGVNPHEMLAPLLSHRLNELAVKSAKKHVKATTGNLFISLLRNTLPVLQEIAAIRASSKDFPALVVQSVQAYRLVWDVEGSRRHALDLVLLPRRRWVISDGSLSSDPSCGRITAIPQATAIFDQVLSSHEGTLGGKPHPLRLDNGRAVLCEVSIVRETLRALAEGVRDRLGL